MRSPTLQPVSMFAGAALTALAFSTMTQKPAAGGVDYEYKILTDVQQPEVVELTRDGWEFVGYLGQGKKGLSSDETLWRQPE